MRVSFNSSKSFNIESQQFKYIYNVKNQSQTKIQAERRPQRNLPDTGYFSMVDLKVPAPNPMKSRVKSDDLTTRSKDKWISDMIWNSNWVEWMEIEEQIKQKRQKQKKQQLGNKSGFVSLARRDELNSQDKSIDEELKVAKQIYEQRVAHQKEMAAKQKAQQKFVEPRKDELSYWKRQVKYVRKSQVLNQDQEAQTKSLQQQQADSQIQYEVENKQNLLWTIAIGLLGTGLTLGIYSEDLAYSFFMGSIFGVLYLRLLAKSIEGIGGDSALAALGQPRILIPLVLALIYNKWHKVQGFEPPFELNFYSLTGGFLSFKLAIVLRQTYDLIQGFVEEIKKQNADRNQNESVIYNAEGSLDSQSLT